MIQYFKDYQSLSMKTQKAEKLLLLYIKKYESICKVWAEKTSPALTPV